MKTVLNLADPLSKPWHTNPLFIYLIPMFICFAGSLLILESEDVSPKHEYREYLLNELKQNELEKPSEEKMKVMKLYKRTKKHYWSNA